MEQDDVKKRFLESINLSEKNMESKRDLIRTMHEMDFSIDEIYKFMGCNRSQVVKITRVLDRFKLETNQYSLSKFNDEDENQTDMKMVKKSKLNVKYTFEELSESEKTIYIHLSKYSINKIYKI